MERMIERCAGLDVHRATVVVCLLIQERGRRPRTEVRTFGTMTHKLEALRDWLVAAGVTHVGMGSTGVYWRPVHAVPGPAKGNINLINRGRNETFCRLAYRDPMTTPTPPSYAGYCVPDRRPPAR